MFSRASTIKDCMRIRTGNNKGLSRCIRRVPKAWGYFFACSLVVLAYFPAGCRSGSRLPDPSSKAYADFTSAFYVGLAALQVGDDVRAEANLGRATQLVPEEPAAWANWGILALRQR